MRRGRLSPFYFPDDFLSVYRASILSHGRPRGPSEERIEDGGRTSRACFPFITSFGCELDMVLDDGLMDV